VTEYLPVVDVEFCQERLGLIFPRDAFDAAMTSPVAAAAVSALIYIGAIDEGVPADDQTWARPSMVLWLNDSVLAHASDEERFAWWDAARRSKRKVEALEASWGIKFEQRYRDGTREPLRDETFPRWREQGAMLSRAGFATSYPGPIWALAHPFADLFDPDLTGDDLTAAIDAWTQTHMSMSGRMRAVTARRLARAEHAVDVALPGGGTRQLEPGPASEILKGVVEQWAPKKLASPLVLSISEPGDHVYVVDRALLAQLNIEIDETAVLPDALIVDGGVDPAEFWIIEAVASDGEINERRKVRLLEWAESQGVPSENCRFLTAFVSRNAEPARRRLKDLAADTYAWFLDEPDFELLWQEIMPGARPTLAIVTPISD
jgi:hypothetical protein